MYRIWECSLTKSYVSFSVFVFEKQKNLLFQPPYTIHLTREPSQLLPSNSAPIL
jgi:hypothetical protein